MGEEKPALQAVLKSIEKSGGLTEWNKVDTLSFRKKSVLYLKDGTVESSSEQYQEFVLGTDLQVKLLWLDSTKKKMLYDGTKTLVYEDQEVIDTVEGMNATVASAFYVISKPFNLPADRTFLQDVGPTIIADDSLQTIMVDYPSADKGKDKWWFYFTEKHGFWGSKVFHSPTYALIVNTKMDTSTGFSLPSYRRSFRIDSLNNIEFVRAEFWYSDYVVR